MDDSPRHYIATNKVGVQSFVMNSFVNKDQNTTGVTRVYSFPEFYFHITQKPLFVPRVWKKYLTKQVIAKYHAMLADK